MPSDREQSIVDTVIARLIDARIKKGISPNRLAELTGLSRSGIRHMESGKTNPTLYTLLKIAMALDVKLGRVIGSISRASEQ